MKTVLFDVNNYTGHFNISFPFARLLKRNGYRVVYLGYPYFEKIIRLNGFEYYVFRNSTQDLLKVVRTNIIERLITNNNYLKVKDRIEYYDSMIKDVSPDIVFIDSDHVFRRIFYHGHNVKLVSINTKPYSGRYKYTPPFTSKYIPTKSALSAIYINALWTNLFIKKRISLVLNLLLTGGNDIHSILRRIAKQKNFPFDKLVCYNRVFVLLSFKDISEVVLIPNEINFEIINLENVYHIYINDEIQHSDMVANYRYLAVIREIQRKKRLSEDSRTIYVSFGTMINEDKKYRDDFLVEVRKVCENLPNCIFIFSTGKNFQVFKLFPIPKNLYIFASVPQLHLLKRIDIMINHGGMNSVIECIQNCVPMISYPLSSRWEQKGNAAKVVYHKLGLRGDIMKDTAEIVYLKIRNLIHNYDVYKKRIEQFNLKIRDVDKKEDAGLLFLKRLMG